MKTFRVLSIDGGGSRGILPATILSDIEREFGQPIHTLFDFFIGTSVGGLIALYLAQQQEEKKEHSLEDFFSLKNEKEIFKSSIWKKWLPVSTESKYDGTGKTKIIKKYLKHKSLRNYPKYVAVTAYQLQSNKTKLFRSWDLMDQQYPLTAIANATSAAPTYFPSVILGKQEYIDGGIGANDPTLLGYLEAKKLFRGRIKVLSLGTGYQKSSNAVSKHNWGNLKWVLQGNLIDLLMDAPQHLMSELCEKIIPKGDYLRMNTVLNEVYLDNSDGKYRSYLIEKAHRLFKEKKTQLKEFFREEKEKEWAIGWSNSCVLT